MVHYKLSYLNVKGKGEAIRLIFAYLGLDFEDHRIDLKDWPKWKPKYPWGQVPVLEMDGVVLAQSNAIARMLAKRYGLTGANELEAAKCDEYIDAINDLKAAWKKYARADEAQKEEGRKEFIDVHAPKYLNKLSAIKTSNEGSLWLVGQSLTWADIVVAVNLEFFEESINPNVLDPYPVMKSLKERVFATPNIKKYLEQRSG